MKRVYPVVFTQDEDAILVEVPDLEIYTQGADLAEAIFMARDVIGLQVTYLEDEGSEVPEPSSLAAVQIETTQFYEVGRSFLSLVDIDLDEYRRKNDNRTVRRNVTLPNWLNIAAEKERINVSKVLQEALKEKLKIVK